MVCLLQSFQSIDPVSTFAVAKVSIAGGGGVRNVLYYKYMGLGPPPT
jgi:hypothetical protein